MHTHTTVTKIYYKSTDTYRPHITSILCPCFKLFTVQHERKKSFWLQRLPFLLVGFKTPNLIPPAASSVITSICAQINYMFFFFFTRYRFQYCAVALSVFSFWGPCTPHLWLDLGGQGTTGGTPPCVQDQAGYCKDEVTQRGTGPGRMEGGYSFHDCMSPHAQCT